MDGFKEFKQIYKKTFIKDRDFRMKLPTTTEDNLTQTKRIKAAISQAAKLLSSCSPRDTAHLKILTSYPKLMKMNQENGQNTTVFQFAMMLFHLHQCCVRILRSPWRKDYMVLKAYNGYFHYTFRKLLSPVVIERLLGAVGFQYNPSSDVYELGVMTLNRSSMRGLTEAGIDFFLSYTHCMMNNDPQFWMTLESFRELSPSEAPVPERTIQNHDPSRPGVSGLTMENSRTSSISARNREWNHLPTEATRNSKQGRNHQSTSNTIHGRITKSNTQQSSPLDLSSSSSINLSTPNHFPVSRPDRRTEQIKSLAPRSEYLDDQLYGSAASPKRNDMYRSHPTEAAESSIENSLNGHVLYPPPSLSWLNTPSDGKHHPDSSKGRGNLTMGVQPNGDYVDFFHAPGTRRGSPDGEINREKVFDNVKTSAPSSNRHRPHHIYQEISDENIY